MTTTRPSPVRRLLAGSGVTSRASAVTDVTTTPQADGPPSWRLLVAESTSPLESARLLAAAPRLSRMPRGDGHVVVDVPGWRAPELSGLPLRRYLSWLGYDARSWGFGTNTGNPARDAKRLTQAVAELADASGQPVSLVGWSLGGVVSRAVASERPDLVRRVITYGTPVVGATKSIAVPLTVLYSRRDGIVSWRTCIDRSSPDVEHVEVRSSHIGMGVDPDVWGVVASRLAR
jgi:pimeloyl-ACP methyl ester carboxylesterase